MNHALLASVLLITLLTSGCSYLQSRPRDAVAELEDHLAQERYGRALALIEETNAGHPQYNQLQERADAVRTAARSFARQQSAAAQEAAAAGRWAEALTLYTEALERHPESATLRHGHEALHAQQAARRSVLEEELLLLRGEWLLQALPRYAGIAAIDPRDRGARGEYEAYQAEARRIAAALHRTGLAAIEAKRWEAAGTRLRLARRLHPDAAYATALEQLATRRAETERMARARRLAENRERITALENAFAAANEAGDAVAARQNLEDMAALLGRDHPRVAQHRKRFAQQLKPWVEARMEAAATAYSEKRFEAAIARWREVLQVDPENEAARARIERAERVLERLHRLEAQQRPE